MGLFLFLLTLNALSYFSKFLYPLNHKYVLKVYYKSDTQLSSRYTLDEKHFKKAKFLLLFGCINSLSDALSEAVYLTKKEIYLTHGFGETIKS
jgi:hypothetical protein